MKETNFLPYKYKSYDFSFNEIDGNNKEMDEVTKEIMLEISRQVDEEIEKLRKEGLI